MYYQNLSDLPQDVQETLPEAGQQLYMGAFNDAWQRYDPESDSSEASKHDVVHREAWAIVEEAYVREGNRWVQRKKFD